MSKFEEITNKAKEVAEQAKNYDYKSKAAELKEKAADMADKAKDYDYKEKAKEVSEAVKNFDYEEKAKAISDTVKNYDYKGEAENIKKGGLKYFWNKHRKLSIVAIIILVVGVVALSNSNDATNVKQNEATTSSQGGEKSDEKFIRDDDFAVDVAIDTTYKAVGGKEPRFVSADIIERNKNNEYLIEVIWKEDTSSRYTTNFVFYIKIEEKLPDKKYKCKWDYDFTNSENYLEDLVPKFKSDIGWVDK